MYNKEGSHILNQQLREDFNTFIQYYLSGDAPNDSLKTDPILTMWRKSKSHLYDLFGQNLVLKFPITVPENVNAKYIREYLLDKAFKFEEAINPFDEKTCLTNSIQKDTVVKDIVFPRNMKFTRAINKIINDPREFITFDSLYSKVLNSGFTEGNLCFSIHPLDFLTMGNNQIGWTSCQSLEGQYKSGLLSLMCDDCTIVCYVEDLHKKFIPFRAKHDEKLPDMQSKIWRQLIHIDPKQELAVFNFHYPFQHDYIHLKAVDILKNEIMKSDSAYTNELSKNISYHKYVVDYVYDECKTDLHFNDLNYSGKVYNFTFLLPSHDVKTPMIIGSCPPCPLCGIFSLAHHATLVCDSCDPIEYCCTCAEPFVGEELHDYDGEYFCDECFDDVFMFCPDCDELIYRSNYDRFGECTYCDEENN